jgi:hypothetical protein
MSASDSAKESPVADDLNVHDDAAADARVQVVFGEEVRRVVDGVVKAGIETVAEGRLAGSTAEQAIGYFRAKVKQFLGPWT